jgi:hypothetical protein
MLGSIFSESLKGEENGRILLTDLEDIGALHRSATPVGALFLVPAIPKLFSELSTIIRGTADPDR